MWVHNCFLRAIIRSRVLMGFLCFVFLMFSFRVALKSCNASEMEMAPTSFPQIALGINWNLSSMPHIPFEDRCSCSSSMKSCCVFTNSNIQQNFHGAFFYKKPLHASSLSPATLIKIFDFTPFNQKDRSLPDLNYFHQKDLFLVTCVLLI